MNANKKLENQGEKEISKNNGKEEIRKRGKRMVKLLQGSIGTNLGKLPVPPLTKWLNGIILDAKRGEVKIKFKVREEMSNPTSLLHGGIHSAMMDDTIGVTCTTLGYEGFLITIDFHVDYLGKAHVGEEVVVYAKIKREGKRIVHAIANITNAEGSVISTANANLLKTTFTPDYNKMAKDS